MAVSKNKKYWIYFAQDAYSGLVKIGVTESISKRINLLRIHGPKVPSILRKIRGGFQYERWLHNYFAKYRVCGEWFTFCPEMLTVKMNNPIREGIDRIGGIWSGNKTLGGKKMFNIHLWVSKGVPEKHLSVFSQKTGISEKKIRDWMKANPPERRKEA